MALCSDRADGDASSVSGSMSASPPTPRDLTECEAFQPLGDVYRLLERASVGEPLKKLPVASVAPVAIMSLSRFSRPHRFVWYQLFVSAILGWTFEGWRLGSVLGSVLGSMLAPCPPAVPRAFDGPAALNGVVETSVASCCALFVADEYAPLSR